MPGFHYEDGIQHDDQAVAELVASYPLKFAWFLQSGYVPHYWQTLFHTASKDNDPSLGLARFRHLVAGRRGGKTLSAAKEVGFYLTHPEEFHWDYHRVKDSKPLYAWVITKDFPTGHAAKVWFREVLKEAGLEHGREYKENRGNNWFEFENGSFLHFRSAEDPESLRGAGLDILWMDESAFIPSARPWEVARPALAEKVGMVITTTTPDGKNWFYKEFWSDLAKSSSTQARVEYRSIDNPYFPEEEWLELQRTYHPMLFKQEFMASFDAMEGRELHGEWLKYYDTDELPKLDGKYDLDIYIGIDPAISLSEEADRFAIGVVGVTKDKTQAYLLDLFAGRIPFPEQIEKIEEYHLKWQARGRVMFIGVEAVAYQQALAQQALRIPGFLPIVQMFAPGKKHIRILSMSPLFRTGRVKLRKEHLDFIDEWLDYDSTRRNPSDDCLDAVEIALRTAGALLPSASTEEEEGPPGSMQELANRRFKALLTAGDEFDHGYDEFLGADW